MFFLQCFKRASALIQFTSLSEQCRHHGQDAQKCTGDKKSEQQQCKRCMPFIAEEKTQRDFMCILQRKAEEQDKEDCCKNSGNKFHVDGSDRGVTGKHCTRKKSIRRCLFSSDQT